MLKQNKNILRHFRMNVMDNVRMLGQAIDAIDPISESYARGMGFVSQYDRFAPLGAAGEAPGGSSGGSEAADSSGEAGGGEAGSVEAA
mmetsp:Transcript_21819/g.40874  ORF Transcript_21819/g.40874 Transcript_21819/m.40874 type:complete len:88 (+) Transcript_21819:115-378(+)